MSIWMPDCKRASRLDVLTYACPEHDPVIPADCAKCEHRPKSAATNRAPAPTLEGRTTMQGRAPGRPPKDRETSRDLSVTERANKLKEMGFVHVPEHLLTRSSRGGKFISVSFTAGKPIRLVLSQDIVASGDLEKGMALDPYYEGKRLAFIVGYGPLVLAKQGKCLSISCPKLLEKMGVTQGQRWTAECEHGVLAAEPIGGVEGGEQT